MQQQPIVHIPETDMPGPNGVHLEDAPEVKPAILHVAEDAVAPRTDAQDRAFYQAAEADILAGLFEALDEADVAVAVCTFPRFKFPVKHPDGETVQEPMRIRFRKQSDADIEAAQRRATMWVANRDIPNGPRVEQVNQARMRSWVIYNATVPEDKARYWDQTALVQRLRVGNGVEVIDKLLDAGEKLQAVNTIYGFSGLMANEESELERVAKP
jgi:hypothetical protein